MKQETLRAHLMNVRNSQGSLTAGAVVTAASPKASPLHVLFEWDNTIAGNKYREQQASELIRSVKVSYRKDDRDEDMRYFVSVETPDGYVYEPSEEVVKDEILTSLVLRTMEREWRQMQSRYGHFQEFVDLVRSEIPTVS